MATALTTTVSNLKGGVGKTTTVMNLGASLAQKVLKVLLIDSDPQANLTSYLKITPGEGAYADVKTLDELYLAKKPFSKQDKNKFLIPTDNGLDIISTDEHLSGVEFFLMSRARKRNVLRDFLEDITPYYDYILIDTPPSLNLLTMNALVASDRVLIPVQTEFFSCEGIVKISSLIQSIQGHLNPSLKILGLLPTQVSLRRKLTQEVLEALKTEFDELVFENFIHENSALAESSGQGKSIFQYQKNSQGAQDYLLATNEFIHKMKQSLK